MPHSGNDDIVKNAIITWGCFEAMKQFGDVINRRITITGRMWLLGFLMILPVLFTGYLLYQTHHTTIDFANTEVNGTRQLKTLWPDVIADARDGSRKDGERLTVINEQIARIADQSNLTLDPNLDSYYLMDAVAVKLPALLVEGQAAFAAPDSGDEDAARLMHRTLFATEMARLKASADKSGQYSRRKSLSPETQAALEALSTAAKQLEQAPDQAAYSQFVGAADTFFGHGRDDLETILARRIAKETRRLMTELGVALGVLVVALCLTIIIATGLSRRLKVLSGMMQRLVKGETVSDIPYQSDLHETGVIVQTLIAFRRNLAETEEMRLTQHRLEEESITARRAAMLDMADHFETSVLGIIEGLGQSTQALGRTAMELSAQAGQTRNRSHDVAQAMETASGNIQSVAGATEEMAASSSAISDQATQASEAAAAAAAKAQETMACVEEMNMAASRIGTTIELITRITAQTNLLALNATIEAARADTAGRGFSVVATEVKALAQQTALATEEIRGQIRAVQEATGHAAEAMSTISGMVVGLSDISGTISQSVGQQTSAVGEISRATAEVAMKTSDITEAVDEVRTTAGQTGYQAEGALREVRQLTTQTEALKATALDFLATVRAA
ncbi:methyl-accepting chemotaxis protein [Asticcacaulis taihuensis]|uniref:Methyl-accepting chemotaxis protein n=2 Tax=Asticcacaulis taihuensis TaxID=260084 RepID=A0A1G4RHZ5_9CAUL|nr:methyl-accepting chemotaxis protein [Asticcacaulis taihuensis]